MVFWRKKKNEGDQERDVQDDELLHHKTDPDLEPATEYDSEMDEGTKARLHKSEEDIIEELDTTPVPDHTPEQDSAEAEELGDHSSEGGWLSRLTKGLSKSTNKLGGNIADVFTKRKLDDAALEELEDILIMADMGPKTAAKLVENFSKERFDKEIEKGEVQKALAAQIAEILQPVVQPLDTNNESGPFVMLVCGVNGAGKTTTIGKLAHDYHIKQKKNVMIAAGDTFRAAAVEQLDVWAQRAHVPLIKKDIGADSAAVAYEAYEKAKADNVDILRKCTACRCIGFGFHYGAKRTFSSSAF